MSDLAAGVQLARSMGSRRRMGRRIPKKYMSAYKRYSRFKRYRSDFKKAMAAAYPQGSAGSIAFYGEDENTANPLQKSARKMFKYKGPGAYFSENPWMAKGIRAAGGWLGDRLVPGVGGTFGTELGARASKYLGFGAYDTPVSSNDLVLSHPGGGAQQAIGTVGDETGDLMLQNTEFIGNVVVLNPSGVAGSSGFQITRFELNPGIAASFPFLSQIAQNYELYDWKQLLFQYKPLSGESGAASNNLGSLIMATQYDPDGSQFLNKIQMQNYAYANSTKPSCGAVHGIECKPNSSATNMLYVRVGASNRDRIFTDIGTFQVATEGIPFAAGVTQQIIGEIHVTYTVHLSRPQLFNSILGYGIVEDVFTSAPSVIGGTIGAFTAGSRNLIGGSVTNVSNTLLRYSFPRSTMAGTYLIMVKSYSPVATLRFWQVMSGAAGAVITSSNPIPGTSVSTNWIGCQSVVVINNTSGVIPTVDIPMNLAPDQVMGSQVLVIQVNSEININF